MYAEPYLKRAALVLVLAVVAQAVAAPRMFFVPAGDDPSNFSSGTTVITSHPGSRFCVEEWVTGDPTEIYAVQYIVADGSGGVTGTVIIDGTSPLIDQTHPMFVGNLFPGGVEFVAFQNPNLCCVPASGCTCREGFAVAGEGLDDTATIPTTSAYVGELCFDVSIDAAGTFSVVWEVPDIETKLVDPVSFEAIPGVVYDVLSIEVGPCTEDSDCVRPSNTQCQRASCNAGICSFVNKPYGDVDNNGTINLFDLFCVLDAISDLFPNCTFEDVDIHGTGEPPCTPNMTINLQDLFAVLNAFSDIDPCCTP